MSKRIIERFMMKLGSRKWWAWVSVIALATTGLYMGKLEGRVWVDAITWATGIYLGANVLQKLFLRGTK